MNKHRALVLEKKIEDTIVDTSVIRDFSSKIFCLIANSITFLTIQMLPSLATVLAGKEK